MSTHKSLLCRDLIVEKQHRCSYTGGKAVYSHLDNNWIACLNNQEITFLSTINGEIIMNTNALGECIQTLSPLNKSIKHSQEMDNILTFDVSLNDKFIAVSTRQHFIRIIQIIYDETDHQITDLKLIKEFKTNNKSSVRQLIFNSNHNMIIGGTGDGSVLCWNTNNGFVVHQFNNAHFLPKTILKMNPYKHYQLISGSSDTKLKCYNLRNNKVKTLENVHKSPIVDIEFMHHQNAPLMITVGMNDCVCVWNANNHQRLSIIDSVYSFTNILPLKNMIMLSDESGFIHFYKICNIENALRLKECKKDQKQICQSALNNICKINKKDIMITSLDCNFHFGSLMDDTFCIDKVLIGYNDEMLDIDILDETRIVIASNSCNLKLFDYNTLSYTLLIGHNQTIMSVAVNKDTNIIASASKDKTIRYWKDNKCISIASGHNASVNCITNIVGNLFISGCADGEIKVWDLSTCVKTLMCHEDEVNNFDVSINKEYIVSCGADSKINLFEFAIRNDEVHMEPIKFTMYHKGKTIWSVKFSKNDKLIASAHNNGQIRLWSITELKCVKTLQSVDNYPILDLLFINYSTQIISTTSNGVVSVWSLKDNECIKEYKNHCDKIWRIVELNENKYISIGCDSVINIWNDKTVENEKNKLIHLHEVEINKTKISNFIRNKQYKYAIKLCLQLDEPQRLFGLLLSQYDDIKHMDKIIMALDYKELALLITYLFDFNTGSSKYCFLCQSIFHIIYSNFDIDDLLKLQLNRTHINEKQQIIDLNVPEIMLSDRKQNFAQLNSALIAYSTRHLKRVENIMLNLSIIDSLL